MANLGDMLLNPNDTDIESIGNLEKALNSQLEKLQRLRSDVRKFKFVPVDPMGSYVSVTYKAIDGGRMKITFEPLELELVEVADSFGNLKMRFILPKMFDETESSEATREYFENDPIIKKFLNLLGETKVGEISEILTNSDAYMELSEWACIFDRIIGPVDEPIILMRDGILRTKKLKAEKIEKLVEVLKEKRRNVKLVGVSKTSKVMTLLSTAIAMEHVFPPNAIGYVKIPKDVEKQAYKWTGSGKITEKKSKLDYAFGDMYIAKLARNSNLLVTIEIPRDLKHDVDVYDENQIQAIMAHLAKDSAFSYPSIGYPQTIMKAHESAARVGFPASVVRDKVLDKLREKLDDRGSDYMRDAALIAEFVDKGVLGGGIIDE